ncbi:MAG: multidrug effflux MFS transporter [Pseudomonadota bacterium]
MSPPPRDAAQEAAPAARVEADPVAAAAEKRLSQTEFIALMGILFSTIAFAIDAMLPALPEIAAELAPEAPNRAQLIITSFVLGMGIGTFVTGPLSDAFGRKPIIIGGAVLYIAGAILAFFAQTLELILAARFVQGLGAAGPRVVAVAIVRDLYEGRTMARIMSFIFIVFSLVPAIAPTLGAGIIWLTGWRGIFGAFVLFALSFSVWMGLRQPETLPAAKRRPFRLTVLLAGVREVLANPMVRLVIATQALSLGILFGTLSSTQQVFDVTYGQGAHFHLWFGLIAILAASASFVNAVLVERLGMRVMVTAVLAGQIGLSSVACLLLWTGALAGPWEFALVFVWMTGVFFQAGLTIGNLNAMALQPMGHIAGTAASVVGAASTVGAVLIAAPIGLAFNGTAVPLVVSTLVLALVALWLMRRVRRFEDEVPAVA